MLWVTKYNSVPSYAGMKLMVDGIIMFVSEIILRLRSGNNLKQHQFRRQDNKPIELWSNKVIFEKVRYLHNDPVESGLVEKVKDYLITILVLVIPSGDSALSR